MRVRTNTIELRRDWRSKGTKLYHWASLNLMFVGALTCTQFVKAGYAGLEQMYKSKNVVAQAAAVEKDSDLYKNDYNPPPKVKKSH